MLDRNTLLGDAPEFLKSAAWLTRGWLLAERGSSEELERLLFAEPTTHEFSPVAKKAIGEWATIRSEALEGQRCRRTP
ncbi:hypothetical protein [Micromonospora echinofusca]|uniref:Uncharacterized protein n=1 Tax=Micromonospora echinofusca TaxID=47858 RepID=A0ABS3VL74_MICEH|nr:hypothetical protein [Micromonospora echinofusca]MBO4205211.1 hypothetical protein [Micromonospora echinofusca]